MPATPPHPVDSATVIVLREPVPGSCEVLLVERHAGSRAFAGASVFPGGMVDPEDTSPELQAASRDLAADAAAARLGETCAPRAALGFWIAAIRELFEETGILLASRGDGPLETSDDATRARMRRHRMRLLDGTVTFAEIVTREELSLRAQDLGYFSRWITPVNAPRRYDARFFVTRLPDGQEAVHDTRETTNTVWLTPRLALDRAQAGTLLLTPPTIRTLEELHDLASIPAVLTAARDRRVSAILPKVTSADGAPAILYPDDADYGATEPTSFEGTVPASPDRRDRMIMRDGIWNPIRS